MRDYTCMHNRVVCGCMCVRAETGDADLREYSRHESIQRDRRRDMRIGCAVGAAVGPADPVDLVPRQA